MTLGPFELVRPEALVLLALVPWVVWLMARRRPPVMRLPSRAQVRGLPRTFVQRARWLPHALRVVALVLVVLALARPQLRTGETRDVTVEGIDIVLALDVSTSMKAADFRPRNRLHVAREVIHDFVAQREDDRIGLVVFAGEAFTQAPLTFDHGVLASVLDSVRTGVIEDGTAIGNALATSLNRLEHSEAQSKVVILVTDGDNNAGSIAPREAAAIAEELGVRVYTIMVGRGGKVPYPVGRDPWGRPAFQEVEIPVNPELLQDMARTTGGAFYVATDKESLEQNFQAILDELEKTRLMEGGVYVQYTEAFPGLVLPAVLLVLLELVLAATRFRTFP